MGIPKNRILTGAYVAVLTIIFLYYLFPADIVQDYLAYQVSKANPAVKVEIERVKPAFPPGLKLRNVSLYHLGNKLGSLESVKIRPAILSLFGSESRWSFNGKCYSGNINGNAAIASRSAVEAIAVDTQISGIQLKEIPAVQQLPEYNIDGILDGTLTYSSNASHQTLNGALALADCQFNFKTALINLGLLTFKEIKADLQLQNQTLTIKQCSFAGRQLDGGLSGSVILRENFSKNMLNLIATIEPHHEFLAILEKSLPVNLFKGLKGGKDGFSFKIKGTPAEPQVALN